MFEKILKIEDKIFRGSKFNFLVLGRDEIKSFTAEIPYLIISISDPEKTLAEISELPSLIEILRLKFHDIDKNVEFKFKFGESTDVFMTSEQAKEILSFVEKHENRAKLIVSQCEQGISRSAGIAAALSKIWQNEDEYFLKNYWANRWVYNLLVETAKE